QLTEERGYLVGARFVRDGYQVMLISTAGTVIKMPVDGIRRTGRATQGVIVMKFRNEDERVSALAPVVESDKGDADESGGGEEPQNPPDAPLDYWTNKAQIPTKGKKQRIYDIDALETVMLIKQAKDKGLNLGAAIDAARRFREQRD